VLLNSSRFCAEHGLNDLHVFDPVAEAWTDLSAAISGSPPSPRWGHGFTSAGDKLYVFGGWDDQGDSLRLLCVRA
jgi:N-acetylneuraminic acid mutarotase